jgi:hypothetical protein
MQLRHKNVLVSTPLNEPIWKRKEKKNYQSHVDVTDPHITNVPTGNNGEFLLGVFSNASLQVKREQKYLILFSICFCLI